MILLFMLTTFLIVLVYILLKQHFSPLRHLPNPDAWPLVNQIPFFLQKTDHLNIVERFCNMYKKNGAFRVTRNLFEGEAVCITKVHTFKKIMSRPDVFHRIEFLKQYFPLTGNGLLTSTGKQHDLQKKLLSKAFSSLHLKNNVPAFNKHSAVLVKVLQDIVQSHENGCNIEIQQYFRLFAFDVMGQIAFGYNFESQISKESTFVSTLYNQIDVLANVKLRILLDVFPFLWRLPFGPAMRLKEAERETNNLIEKLLENRKQRLIQANLTDEEENDLLALMIKARDDETKAGMTDQLIKDNSYTLLVAAVDSTSITMSWFLLELAKHPECQRRARDEVLQNLKESDITYEDIASIPFTYAFLKEVLRVHPAFPYTARVAKKEVTVCDHNYPKGTLFALPLFYYNIDSFENGTDFQPERFMNADNNNNNTSAGREIYTYSYGPYSCIGRKTSMMQIMVAVIYLLKNFEFFVDRENEEYIRCSVATVMTDRSIKIRIKSLQNQSILGGYK